MPTSRDVPTLSDEELLKSFQEASARSGRFRGVEANYDIIHVGWIARTEACREELAKRLEKKSRK